MNEIDAQIAQEIFFEKYKYISIEDFEDLMQKSYNNIMTKILKNPGAYNNKRLKLLLKDIKSELTSIYSITETENLSELELVTGTFLASESKIMKTKLDTKLLDQVFNFENDYVQGYTFAELFQTQNAQTYNRIKKILTVNLIQGINPKEFSNELHNAQVRLTKAQMYTSTRTYAKSLREKTKNETEKTLKGMKGRMSLATLDSNTSAICIKKDKEFYDIKEFKKREDILDRPPRHFNCRSILVRITEDTLSYTRASNGDKKEQVDTRTTFNSFLKRNPATAKKLLGTKRYDLYKSGKYNVNEFISDNGTWFNLDELKTELT